MSWPLSRPLRTPARVSSARTVPTAGAAGGRRRAAVTLSVIAGLAMAAASAAGLLVDRLYQDPESTSSMLRGYDLVTLLVAVPLLATALWGMRRGPPGPAPGTPRRAGDHIGTVPALLHHRDDATDLPLGVAQALDHITGRGRIHLHRRLRPRPAAAVNYWTCAQNHSTHQVGVPGPPLCSPRHPGGVLERRLR